MSSGNNYERLFKLGGTIAKLVMDGRRDPEKVADVFQTIVDEKTSTTKPSSILRPIKSGLVIPATNGQRTFAQASDIFTGGIYGESCDVAGKARLETRAVVHELIKDGTLQQIFEGQGFPLDQLCWEQEQVIQFVINHREHLHPQGYATFFLLPSSLVAGVRWHDARLLKVYVSRLAHVYVWFAGYRLRVVLPQLAL